ncbi:MAG: adenosylcobinamide-GDP ribazoletransferase [Rhodospirillaceae bacterium TMED167]|nr:adenosylcobinamide-GDP ribazoletransferase [Rhodospirillaceae bacterium]OUW26993.1 MAG: adenosylcobinamide-GDP ribazoletransferase [Rhodospirillaceae bacterium TMED167]
MADDRPDTAPHAHSSTPPDKNSKSGSEKTDRENHGDNSTMDMSPNNQTAEAQTSSGPGQDWMDDLQICLMFLTRIPVPGGLALSDPSLAQACRFFPVIGALVGVIGAIVLAVANQLNLPQEASVLLAISAMVMVTGGLHEDGISDTADGLGGGSNKDRRLEIMKDSRVGAFGVIALVLVIGLKWAGLAALSIGPAALAVFAGAVISRGVLPLFMRYLPPAKDDGLSADAGRPGFDRVALSLGITLVVAFIGLGFWLTIGVAIVVALVTGAMSFWVKIKIGGQTGDILGALQQLGEISVILTLAAAAAS